MVAVGEQSRPSDDVCVVLECNGRRRVGDDNVDISLRVLGQRALGARRDTDLVVVQELAPSV